MESVKTVNLEDLSKIFLSGWIQTLEKRKQILDTFTGIVKDIDNREGEFLRLFLELEDLNEKMLLYFYETDVHEKMQVIRQSIERVKSEYERKGYSLKEEIANTKFDKEKLNEYYKELCSFLDAEIKSVKNEMECQRGIFNESINRIKDELAVVRRLISTLIRKFERNPEKSDLGKFLTLKQEQIKEIGSELPSQVEDLKKIYEKNKESFKGLYKRTRSNISLLREDLRGFAIKNGLIEEKEIVVLEIIYETSKKEFEFNEILEHLKEKMPEISDEKAQNILLSLSRKGFFVLKIFTD